MNDFDLGYSAGLYEGEGSFLVNRTHGARAIRIEMRDREPLEKMQALWGGSLTGPHHRDNPNHSSTWRWFISDGIGIHRFIETIMPLLGLRRQRQLTEGLIGYAVKRGPRGPMGRSTDPCPTEPYPTQAGVHHHRKLGTPVCEVCRECFRMQQRQYRHRLTASEPAP